MLLYHGTNEEIALQSLDGGLLPRSETGVESVWECESCPEYVYLTTAYAAYFAANASDEGERWGIVEIDLECLDPDDLYPDEDFLEQATRGKGPAPEGLNMEERTEWFREHLPGFQHHWQDSLNNIGNVAYFGGVPSEAITRISLYDPLSNPTMTMLALDPTITIMNYHILGGSKYRALTSWFMGDEINPIDIEPTMGFLSLPEITPMMRKQVEGFQKALQDRSGIKVINNPNYDGCDDGPVYFA